MNFKRIFASLLCFTILFSGINVYASDPKLIFLKAFADTNKQLEKESKLINDASISDELILDILSGISQMNFQAGVDVEGDSYKVAVDALINNIAKDFKANVKTEEYVEVDDDIDFIYDAPKKYPVNLEFDIYLNNDMLALSSPQLTDKYMVMETSLSKSEFEDKKLVKESAESSSTYLLPVSIDYGFDYYKAVADSFRFDNLFGATANLEEFVTQAENVSEAYTGQFLKLLDRGTYTSAGTETIKTVSGGNFVASNYRFTISGEELTAWCHELSDFVAEDKTIYNYYKMIYNDEQLAKMVVDAFVELLDMAYFINPISYTISVDADGFIVKHKIHGDISVYGESIIVDVVWETKGRTYLMNDVSFTAKISSNGETYGFTVTCDGYSVPVNGRYDYNVKANIDLNGQIIDFLDCTFKLNTRRTKDNMSMVITVPPLGMITGTNDENVLVATLEGDYVVDTSTKSVSVNVKDSSVKIIGQPEIKLNASFTFAKASKANPEIPQDKQIKVLDLSQTEFDALADDMQDKYYTAVYGMSQEEYNEYVEKLWEDIMAQYADYE